MKKLLSSLLVTFSFMSIVSASSGACSGHDGVNCMVGPDADGSVICNDDWRGSSVLYSDIRDVCGEEYTELLFNDVAKYTMYYESIKFVKEEGIVEGYPSDAELEAAVPEEGCFPDARKEDWFSKYVCYAKDVGYIDGYPDGTFGPGNNINVVEAMKIVFEAFDYMGIDHTDDGVWYNKYTKYADANDLWVDAWKEAGLDYATGRGGDG